MMEETLRPNPVSPEADLNYNNCRTDSKKNGGYDSIQESETDLHWLLAFGERHPSPSGLLSNTNCTMSTMRDIYEDMAKNFDANLAELDIETFRCEDMNSLLSLPPTYTATCYTSEQGEQIASVSNSLISNLDMTQSSLSVHSSVATSDISICKSELLFSPLKENPNAFSMDSLDCELYEEPDFIRSCQANKHNYMLAFEGSLTPCSDDSDYHDTTLSDGQDSYTDWASRYRLRNCVKMMDNSMIQSDYVYRTWSKLKSVNELTRECSTEHLKSKSLPNLFCSSGSSSQMDSRLSQMQVSTDSGKCVPIFDIQNTHISHSCSSETSQHSFSLVRLFMQSRETNDSSRQTLVNAQSDSSGYLTSSPPLKNGQNSQELKLQSEQIKKIQNLFQSSLNSNNNSSLDETDFKCHKEDVVQRQKNLMCQNEKGINVSGPYSPIRLQSRNGSTERFNDLSDNEDFIASIDDNALQCESYNDANIEDSAISENEDEQSTFFEDSLTECNLADLKSPLMTPVQEELPDILRSHSSFNEEGTSTIRKSPSGTSINSDCTKNNQSAIECHRSGASRDSRSSMEVINNFFPTAKSKISLSGIQPKRIEIVSRTLAHDTSIMGSVGGIGAKMNNDERKSVERGMNHLGSPLLETQSNILNNVRRNSGDRLDLSPNSSGYASSRQGSVERFQRNSLGYINNTQPEQPMRRRLNVTIATMKSCSTQIPAHVCDQSVQTSFLLDSSELLQAPSNASTPHTPDSSHSIASSPSCNKCLHKDTSVGHSSKIQPNFSLPDLSFLRPSTNNILSPQAFADMFAETETTPKNPAVKRRTNLSRHRERPVSCPEVDVRRHMGLSPNFGHVEDWDSLSMLLPKEFKNLKPEFLSQPSLQRTSSCQTCTKPCNTNSSGGECLHPPPSVSPSALACNFHYVCPKCGNFAPKMATSAGLPRNIEGRPPVPQRSVSLPSYSCHKDNASSIELAQNSDKRSTPKGILRKPSPTRSIVNENCKVHNKRLSMSDMAIIQEREINILKRRSLQEPYDMPHDNGMLVSHKAILFSFPQGTTPTLPPSEGMQPTPCNSTIVLSPSKTSTRPEFSAGVPSSLAQPCTTCYKVKSPPTAPSNIHSLCECNNTIDTTTVKMDNKNHLRVQEGDLMRFSADENKLSGILEKDDMFEDDSFSSHHSSGDGVECEANGPLYCTCMMNGCNRTKKSVSFSENIHVRLSESVGNDETAVNLMSPFNCYDHHPMEVMEAKRVFHHLSIDSNHHCNTRPSPIHEDLEVETPPGEFTVSPRQSPPPSEESSSTISNSSSLSQIQPSLVAVTTSRSEMVVDVSKKKTLILAVNNAVDLILSHFEQSRDPVMKASLGDTRESPAIGYKILHKLCPAVFEVLADGLQLSLYSFFGRIQNSVWRVIEASAQQGASAKPLNDLVTHLNSMEEIKEGNMKFNAFIFGLLNIKSLDSWFGYLRTRESILQKHYQSDAFLLLASSATKRLCDDLLVIMQPLAMLPFNLDLAFEHQHVLQNLCEDSLTNWPIQLIRSLPGQEPGDQAPFQISKGLPTVGRELVEVIPALTKCDSAITDMVKDCDVEPLSPLKQWPFTRSASENVKPFLRRPARDKERAGHQVMFLELASNVKKRWSSFEIGSRLVNAFDKVLLEASPLSRSVSLTKLDRAGSKADLSRTTPPNTPVADIREANALPPKKPARTHAVILASPKSFTSEFATKTSGLDQFGSVLSEPENVSPPGGKTKHYQNDTSIQSKSLKALCHHLATERGQLSFDKGDIMTVIGEVDSDWLLCNHGTEEGLVPRVCVESTDNQ